MALGILLLPTAVSLSTDDVEDLASYTGGYAGVGVQFVVPSLLVLAARRRAVSDPGTLASPFKGKAWPLGLLVWSAITLVLITLDKLL